MASTRPPYQTLYGSMGIKGVMDAQEMPQHPFYARCGQNASEDILQITITIMEQLIQKILFSQKVGSGRSMTYHESDAGAQK